MFIVGVEIPTLSKLPCWELPSPTRNIHPWCTACYWKLSWLTNLKSFVTFQKTSLQYWYYIRGVTSCQVCLVRTAKTFIIYSKQYCNILGKIPFSFSTAISAVAVAFQVETVKNAWNIIRLSPVWMQQACIYVQKRKSGEKILIDWDTLHGLSSTEKRPIFIYCSYTKNSKIQAQSNVTNVSVPVKSEIGGFNSTRKLW